MSYKLKDNAQNLEYLVFLSLAFYFLQQFPLPLSFAIPLKSLVLNSGGLHALISTSPPYLKNFCVQASFLSYCITSFMNHSLTHLQRLVFFLTYYLECCAVIACLPACYIFPTQSTVLDILGTQKRKISRFLGDDAVNNPSLNCSSRNSKLWRNHGVPLPLF